MTNDGKLMQRTKEGNEVCASVSRDGGTLSSAICAAGVRQIWRRSDAGELRNIDGRCVTRMGKELILAKCEPTLSNQKWVFSQPPQQK